jgi:diguanylate cyclase (GGDEF)-like protein
MFVIPLIITVYSFVFQNSFSVSNAIALGEIAMIVMGIVLSTVIKYKIRVKTALFVSTLTGIALCVVLSHIHLFSFLIQELRVYLLLISLVLTLAFKIIVSKTSEAEFSIGFYFLGISQFSAIFHSVPVLNIAAYALKLYFYYFVTKYLFRHIHQEIMKEVKEARRIKKEFNDVLRYEVKKHTLSMELSQEKIQQLSKTDSLTDAYNRKAIIHLLERMIDNQKIKVFSVLLLDIDKFKSINDTMGHLVGDKCLKSLSIIVKRNLRSGDYLGRYGGDEFIILLPNTDTTVALTVAERFRRCIQEETANPSFTVSIGVATYPADGEKMSTLFEYADAGLYISKENGRNRVSKKP